MHFFVRSAWSGRIFIFRRKNIKKGENIMKDFIGNTLETAALWVAKMMLSLIVMPFIVAPAYLIDQEAGEKIFNGFWGAWT